MMTETTAQPNTEATEAAAPDQNASQMMLFTIGMRQQALTLAVNRAEHYMSPEGVDVYALAQRFFDYILTGNDPETMARRATTPPPMPTRETQAASNAPFKPVEPDTPEEPLENIPNVEAGDKIHVAVDFDMNEQPEAPEPLVPRYPDGMLAEDSPIEPVIPTDDGYAQAHPVQPDPEVCPSTKRGGWGAPWRD